MRLSNYLALVLLLAAMLLPSAKAQGSSPTVMRPAEVMVLDLGGFQLLGYGTLEGRVLRLELMDRVGDFVLLLVGSSGGLERLHGSEDADGGLRLVLPGGVGGERLEAFFEARDIELVVVRRSSISIQERPAPGAPGDEDGAPAPGGPGGGDDADDEPDHDQDGDRVDGDDDRDDGDDDGDDDPHGDDDGDDDDDDSDDGRSDPSDGDSSGPAGGDDSYGGSDDDDPDDPDDADDDIDSDDAADDDDDG